MSEAQTWTVIAGLLTAIFGMMTLMSTMFLRVIRNEIGKLEYRFDVMDSKFEAKFDAIDSKFDAIDAKFDAKFDAMDSKFTARFDSLDLRVSGVESDVRRLQGRHGLGLDGEA